ncbi:TrmH family RNA methyltransferase [Rhodohalobacter sp. SW132]|uniref:RNA methyltransferase n=1 Tax=Rhodohalobacter sp. SW132 TaxID=2293433 RepID=UPI000E26D3E7|nr:RNA methyltransferase [Rhodohalobacter sp. SW132]REL38088.1 TrmH family RNA methyltransferase [Rhodohalobacter sp. SW132]
MRKRSTRRILEDNQNRSTPLGSHFILWLHNIRSLHNVGAAFRNADAFGVSRLLLSGYTPTPPRPEITKTAIGAEEHIPWSTVQNPAESAQLLKNDGYHITGLEQTDQSVILNRFEMPSPKIVLVLGNEVTGIDDDFLPLLDSSVEIPQYGTKHSLNVSVACGVALYGFLNLFEQKTNR